MKMKKVVSIILCAVMLFSLSVSAYAAKPSTKKNEETTSELINDGAFVFDISDYKSILNWTFLSFYPDLRTSRTSTIFVNKAGDKIYACAICDKNYNGICKVMAYDEDTGPTNGSKGEKPIVSLTVSIPIENTEYMSAMLTAIPLSCEVGYDVMHGKDVSESISEIRDMITGLLENLKPMAILASEEQEPNFYDRNGVRYELFFNSLNNTLFFRVSVIQE